MSFSAFLPLILVVLLAVLLAFMFWGVRWTGPSGNGPFLSHLVCEKCGGQFDYAWVPGMSLTSIRWFNSRYMACPVCGRPSMFDIWDTRVDPETHHCNIQIGPL